MTGGPLRSMLILILLTTVRMPPDYVLPFQEPQTKSDNFRTKDRVSSEIRECWTAYPPGSFFLGVQNSTVVHSLRRDSTCTTTENLYKHRPQTSSATIVGSLVTSQGSAIIPSSSSIQNPQDPNHQHSSQHRQQISSEVEYHDIHQLLDYKSDFELKSSTSVKNLFKNSFEFWKNVIKPDDYILNVIKFGYRIEFITFLWNANFILHVYKLVFHLLDLINY